MAIRDKYEQEEENKAKTMNYSNISNQERIDKHKSNALVKFIADSGATEHLSRSELIFEHLDNINHTVRCANKDSSLKTIGSGSVKFRTDGGGEFVLKDVLYSKDLSENLLSLRQFVDQGLQVVLDNKRINIYDPLTKERIVSGIYQNQFWIIKFKIIKDKDEVKEK